MAILFLILTPLIIAGYSLRLLAGRCQNRLALATTK